MSARHAAGSTLIAAAVLLSAAAGCSGPPVPAGGHASSGLHALHPCPDIAAFSCGTLSVRLDPFGSAPGRLSLQVAVSDVPAAPRGVFVLLTGGPGQPGVPLVPRLLAAADGGYRDARRGPGRRGRGTPGRVRGG